MMLYACSDLHLSFSTDKPMTVFGPKWSNHTERLEKAWRELIQPADTVLIPGDISWAMTLEQAAVDLGWLDQLPGKKILVRGNHDYWWGTRRKLEQLAAAADLKTLTFLQNDAVAVGEDKIVCGSRGWLLPSDPEFKQSDQKIYLRELIRLELSLQAACEKRTQGQRLIAMLHYPPLQPTHQVSGFTELLSRYQVDDCVYGHLHSPEPALLRKGERFDGVRYWLASCDQINFVPLCLDDQGA